MSQPIVRFSFVVRRGDGARLASPGWRVWCNKEDTYITCKSFGGKWKVSLHADAAWRVAATSENMAGPEAVLPPSADRAIWTFPPTSFVDGRRLAFVIGMTRAALLPLPAGSKDVLIEAQDRWDWLTTARVWMTEPGVDFSSARLVGGPLTLSSGRRVWVDASAEQVNGWSSDAEPQASNALVQVRTPEKDGVSAPGYLVTGVRLSNQ